ncbi:unnamed protein product [Pleuronectes platessa]|uniref:Uncharacterized protein n=1 Tax=Pleuronectes platessa TaxID=8262 RepID=A0A9N7UJZ6_PLEPL|nr:unnamed protein product [Pleuronectes platessa]
MDDKGEPQYGATGVKYEELPQMDGSCDVCEPDEAQPATQVCHACSCLLPNPTPRTHASRMHHPLMLITTRGHKYGLGTKENAELGVKLRMRRWHRLEAAVANGGERGDAEGKRGRPE